MAIPIYSVKVVKRDYGANSALAAAAYRSGTKIGEADYARKRDIDRDYNRVFLPEHAPEEWRDAETLWRAVEDAEKRDDSQLYRDTVEALPIEAGPEEWRRMADEEGQRSTEDGYACQIFIHPVPGNPHMHKMETMRVVGEDGRFAAKSRAEYLMRREGQPDAWASAKVAKEMVSEGWERCYFYNVGSGLREQLTRSEAEARGLGAGEELGRVQNSVRTGPHDKKSYVIDARKAWECTVNDALERCGYGRTFSMASYEDQGINRVAGFHAGKSAWGIEKRAKAKARAEGYEYVPVTDVVVANEMIRAANDAVAEIEAGIDEIVGSVDEPLRGIVALESLGEEHEIIAFLLDHARNVRHIFGAVCEASGEEYIALRDELRDTHESVMDAARRAWESLKSRMERYRDTVRAAWSAVPERLREAVSTRLTASGLLGLLLKAQDGQLDAVEGGIAGGIVGLRDRREVAGMRKALEVTKGELDTLSTSESMREIARLQGLGDDIVRVIGIVSEADSDDDAAVQQAVDEYCELTASGQREADRVLVGGFGGEPCEGHAAVLRELKRDQELVRIQMLETDPIERAIAMAERSNDLAAGGELLRDHIAMVDGELALLASEERDFALRESDGACGHPYDIFASSDKAIAGRRGKSKAKAWGCGRLLQIHIESRKREKSSLDDAAESARALERERKHGRGDHQHGNER